VHPNEMSNSQEHGATLYASLELSRSNWLVTSLAPGGTKMSKHAIVGGDGASLLTMLTGLRTKAELRAGRPVKIMVLHEAGLDRFWVHRLLGTNGIERASPS
jgi:transposase